MNELKRSLKKTYQQLRTLEGGLRSFAKEANIKPEEVMTSSGDFALLPVLTSQAAVLVALANLETLGKDS